MEHISSIWRALTRERKAKGLDTAEAAFRAFSITEKALFFLCLFVLAAGTLSLVGKISDAFSVTVPVHGGSLSEGVVGTPRFVNPLLAVSDADRDVSALVYSGLLKSGPEGTMIPDLAESYSISSDGLAYTVNIRPDAKWSDGTAVTADDVKFTVEKAQDPALKSPRRVSWDGVTVEKTDDHTVIFHLKSAYGPFINNLSLGILPSRLWKNLTADQLPFSPLNINAIGSGPYVIDSIAKSSDGIASEITLSANPRYALGKPYISTIYLKFYTNEKALVDALINKDVESASNLSPESAKDIGGAAHIMTAPLTRVFGIFFNQNQNELLAHKEVRKALALSIDKDAIIDGVLDGYGTPADGPLPPTIEEKALASSTSDDLPNNVALARAGLVKAGWKLGSEDIYELKPKAKGAASTTLALSLSTADVPELVMSAKQIEESWTSLGVKVDVRVFEPSDLNTTVIRPRKYDALLFGIVTGKNSDLYPFWHSSQRNDPGLNVALYTNQKADKLLEAMRQSTSTADLAAEYASLKAEINADTPAIFLWSPDFLYAVPDKLHGVDLEEITNSSDRFQGIERWYVETDRIWKVFADDRTITNN